MSDYDPPASVQVTEPDKPVEWERQRDYLVWSCERLTGLRDREVERSERLHTKSIQAFGAAGAAALAGLSAIGNHGSRAAIVTAVLGAVPVGIAMYFAYRVVAPRRRIVENVAIYMDDDDTVDRTSWLTRVNRVRVHLLEVVAAEREENMKRVKLVQRAQLWATWAVGAMVFVVLLSVLRRF